MLWETDTINNNYYYYSMLKLHEETTNMTQRNVIFMASFIQELANKGSLIIVAAKNETNKINLNSYATELSKYTPAFEHLLKQTIPIPHSICMQVWKLKNQHPSLELLLFSSPFI